MSEACQAGIQALGLELFSARPAEGLTAFRVPDGLKDAEIRLRRQLSQSPSEVGLVEQGALERQAAGGDARQAGEHGCGSRGFVKLDAVRRG